MTAAIDGHLSRYETKIPLQRAQYEGFDAAMRELGLFPRRSYPDRIVHSIYIDTPDLEDYYDNISGISQRSKTRLRWYDENATHLTLEIKRKRNKVSEKQSIKLCNPLGIIPRHRHELCTMLSTYRHSGDKGLLISHSRYPTLEVEYRRSYFELEDGLRMTIDRHMRFRKLFPFVSGHWSRSPVDTVIEFKYAYGQERVFSELLRNFPNRVFRHSKYVIGVDTACVA